MTDALRRSFAVTFHEPVSDGVRSWLAELDRLTAQLEPLVDAGLCTFEDNTRAPLGANVSFQLIRRFFMEEDRGGGTRVATRVMQALFDLRAQQPAIRVRFYCRQYSHPHGVCECTAVTSRYNNDPTGPPQYAYMSERRVTWWWFIDRADLLALTDDELATIRCHPKTKQHLIDFITWLRANPDAE